MEKRVSFDRHRSNSTDRHLSRNGNDIRGIPKKEGAGNHNWGNLEHTAESMEGLSASTAQRVAANLDQLPKSHSLVDPTRAKGSYNPVRGDEPSVSEQRGEQLRDKPIHRQSGQSQNEDTKIQILDEEAFERLRQAMKS